LFLFCLVFANWILPEHCSLFDDGVLGGQTCHTILMPAGWENICEDRVTASVALTIVVLGICLFFLPFLIFAIKYLRNRPVSQTELFD
jgi:heme/copper-type cytochrome/quinol oxidase subunit 2